MRKAMRWLLVAVVSLFAVIGFQYVTRVTFVQQVSGVGADGPPLTPVDPLFPTSVAMLTGTALLPGNRVEIALNGNDTFNRLWEDLRSGRQSITLQLYYGQPGRVSDTLQRILLDRASAGVRVFVLYDAFGFDRMRPDHRRALEAAGVAIAPFRPFRLSTLYKVQNRSHIRAVVVDGRVGWTGGFGIDDKWLGDGHSNGDWRDTNVRVEGPAVRQLQATFASAWVEATGTLFSGRANTPVTAGSTTAGFLHATPTLGSTEAARFLALSIAGATRTLYITNGYFAPDANFVALLIAAARRGVDVRVLTGGPRSDVAVVRAAGRASYEALLSGGVRIYEWQPTTLHAKTFVVDGLWATVGSINFDNRSLALNDEATLMILDAGLGGQMNAIYGRDLHYATEITAASFRRRSWSQRLVERIAGLLSPVL